MPKARFPPGGSSNLHRLRHDQGWTRRRDDETKAPWLVAPDRSVVIGHDDADSDAIKAEWARTRGFRGSFTWHVAADRLPDCTNPLREAARKVWDGGGRRDP